MKDESIVLKKVKNGWLVEHNYMRPAKHDKEDQWDRSIEDSYVFPEWNQALDKITELSRDWR